jgi:hypothetical protein
LAHLDTAIRIMVPHAEPEPSWLERPNAKGGAWFGRGELARLVLDVLLEAKG